VKTVTCSCGYVAAGETADKLLADVEAHIDAAHSPDTPAPARLSASEAGDVPITTTEAKQ
jgi:hypothetical protein